MTKNILGREGKVRAGTWRQKLKQRPVEESAVEERTVEERLLTSLPLMACAVCFLPVPELLG